MCERLVFINCNNGALSARFMFQQKVVEPIYSDYSISVAIAKLIYVLNSSININPRIPRDEPGAIRWDAR